MQIKRTMWFRSKLSSNSVIGAHEQIAWTLLMSVHVQICSTISNPHDCLNCMAYRIFTNSNVRNEGPFSLFLPFFIFWGLSFFEVLLASIYILRRSYGLYFERCKIWRTGPKTELFCYECMWTSKANVMANWIKDRESDINRRKRETEKRRERRTRTVNSGVVRARSGARPKRRSRTERRLIFTVPSSMTHFHLWHSFSR